MAQKPKKIKAKITKKKPMNKKGGKNNKLLNENGMKKKNN